jgi:hypothetical protein
MIGLQKNEAHRTCGKCQDVTAVSSSLRKSRVSKLLAEGKPPRDQYAITINLRDRTKDVVGKVVFEFYDRRSRGVKVRISLSEKIYLTVAQR